MTPPDRNEQEHAAYTTAWLRGRVGGTLMAAILLVLLVVGCTPGPSLGRVLTDADPLLRSGRAEAALEDLQAARVDYPGSGALLFDIGYAQNAAGEDLLEDGATAAAEAMFLRAHNTFLRLQEGIPSKFEATGAFNAGTVLIRLDVTLKKAERYPERIENMEKAVELLSGLVAESPTFSEAKNNLIYAQQHLKHLQENPPHDSEDPKEDAEDEPAASGTSVDSVTTQIPRARAEVVDGSTIVLHLPARKKESP